MRVRPAVIIEIFLKYQAPFSSDQNAVNVLDLAGAIGHGGNISLFFAAINCPEHFADPDRINPGIYKRSGLPAVTQLFGDFVVRRGCGDGRSRGREWGCFWWELRGGW